MVGAVWLWLALGGIAATVVGVVVAAVAVWQKMVREGKSVTIQPVGGKAFQPPGGRVASARSATQIRAAQSEFSTCREHLEARFLAAAAASGKPRGLAWADCDFETPVTWARDRASDQLIALVGLCVRFTAIEGGGMENNPNVSTPRAATAVFRWADGEWQAEGRTLFNLDPRQALTHFQLEWEPVDLP